MFEDVDLLKNRRGASPGRVRGAPLRGRGGPIRGRGPGVGVPAPGVNAEAPQEFAAPSVSDEQLMADLLNGLDISSDNTTPPNTTPPVGRGGALPAGQKPLGRGGPAGGRGNLLRPAVNRGVSQPVLPSQNNQPASRPGLSHASSSKDVLVAVEREPLGSVTQAGTLPTELDEVRRNFSFI